MITATDKILFIKAAFGGGSIDGRGTNIAVECPSCGKTGKRKLSIHVETGRCHCWVCGLRSRRVSSVLRKHFSREIADEFRVKFEGGESELIADDDEDKADPPITLPGGFRQIFSRSITSDPNARAAARYLLRRGLSVDDIVRHRLGISEESRRRVIIPSFDSAGKLNYFTGRSIDPDVGLRYANCRAKKSDIVFNEINIDWSRELVIVEGPFDLFKCPDNSTCLLGSTLNERHALFKSIATNRTPVVLALDPDMRSKTQRTAELLHSYDCEVRILDVPHGLKDVGEMTHRHVQLCLRSARRWRPMDRLMFSISNIRSGSTI